MASTSETGHAKNLGQDGFKDDKALNKAYSHYSGLESRPPATGRILSSGFILLNLNADLAIKNYHFSFSIK